MNQQLKAKIFLGDERGCNETNCFRSFNTFNFGKYFNEHKSPFEDLYVLNDDTIGANYSISVVAKESSCVLLLPVVGSVVCKVNQGNKITVNVGQLYIFEVIHGTTVELLNCYENEIINFIQVWIKTDVTGNNDVSQLFSFNLDEDKNQLIKITGSINAVSKYPIVSIGKITGRQEAVYKLQNKQNNLFVFVIEGVFEVHGRLLHARDGLGLWDEFEEIELEALSNDAIVLMIELSKR